MDQLDKLIMSYSAQGYNCSQMQFLLSANYHGQENPMLLQALDALAYGNWRRETCGCLLGASCVVALYYDTRGNKEELERRTNVILELTQWFEDDFNSILCDDILKEYDEDKKAICPTLIRQTFIKTMELLAADDIDIYNLNIDEGE